MFITSSHFVPLSLPLKTCSVNDDLIFFKFSTPGDLPYPGIKPGSPALQADSLPSEPPGKPLDPNCLPMLILVFFISDSE